MTLLGKRPKLTEGVSKEGEAFKLVNQLQGQVGFWDPVQVSGATAGTGAYVTLWSSACPAGAWYVQANIVGSGTTGGALYEIAVGILTLAGVSTIIGATAQVTLSREDNAAMDSKYVLTGTLLELQVRDDAAQAMRWKAVVTTMRAL